MFRLAVVRCSAAVWELLLEMPPPLLIGGGLALYMAWAIGANDVANAMGTSVGSGALTIRGAILVAGVLEFGGAFLAGGHVTQTVRKGILDVALFAETPELLVYGMLAALAAAGTWLLLASRAGWPVSTTHSIVGAIVGFGAVGVGVDAVAWGKVGQIAASWVTSPLISGTLAFLIFTIVRSSVLDQPDPIERARRVGPYFVFVVVFTLALVTLFKGLKNLKLDLELQQALLAATALGVVGALVGRVILARVRVPATEDRDFHFRRVETIFGVLQVMTACAVAFAHGSNDVANAIGPLAGVFEGVGGAELGTKAGIPVWMLGLGGLGIVVALATYGYRVMETVGKKITELTPSRGFSAELAAALTIVIASRLGIPISTTHTLVGAVLGVGLARGVGALDLRVVGSIVVSWLVTLPVGALLAIFFFYFFKGLLGG
jgi:PiT family inorganic phosphate transporter